MAQETFNGPLTLGMLSPGDVAVAHAPASPLQEPSRSPEFAVRARLNAGILDIFILGALTRLILGAPGLTSAASGEDLLLFLGLQFAYFFGLEASGGRTIGKRLFHVRRARRHPQRRAGDEQADRCTQRTARRRLAAGVLRVGAALAHANRSRSSPANRGCRRWYHGRDRRGRQASSDAALAATPRDDLGDRRFIGRARPAARAPRQSAGSRRGWLRGQRRRSSRARSLARDRDYDELSWLLQQRRGRTGRPHLANHGRVRGPRRVFALHHVRRPGQSSLERTPDPAARRMACNVPTRPSVCGYVGSRTVYWRQHSILIMRFTDGGRSAEAHSLYYSSTPACGYGTATADWKATHL